MQLHTFIVLQKDVWVLREYEADKKEDDCDEELYTTGNTVVWSRGTTEGGGRVIKSFTLDTQIQQVIVIPSSAYLSKMFILSTLLFGNMKEVPLLY